jgi:hypothetical protein
MKEAVGLREIVARIVETRRDETKISPAWIATEAMRQLHAMTLQRTMPLIYLGCHLQLRQIAREVCRDLFEPEADRDDTAHPLFPGVLWRYPIARQADEEPQYALLEMLSEADVLQHRPPRGGSAKPAKTRRCA